MFSKKQKLKRVEIGEILKKPDFLFKTKNFLLKASSNNLPYPRFTVVVSKKTEKSAVKRHFLKRKINQALKKTSGNLSLDAVVFIFTKDLKNSFEEKEKELENLLKRCIIDK